MGFITITNLLFYATLIMKCRHVVPKFCVNRLCAKRQSILF